MIRAISLIYAISFIFSSNDIYSEIAVYIYSNLVFFFDKFKLKLFH